MCNKALLLWHQIVFILHTRKMYQMDLFFLTAKSKARTSLYMDRTLCFDCYSLEGPDNLDNFTPTYLIFYIVNTLQPCYSTVVFTLKMESVSKNAIFGLKMTVKSDLDKFILKFHHAGNYFPLLHKRAQNYKFSNKNNYLPEEWRNFKIKFSRPLFTILFRPKIVFLDMDSIFLRVKTTVE